MKFTLVFEGELRANGTPAQKHTIREQLHPQLKELWDTHPCLQGLKSRRYLSLEADIGTIYYDHHHSKPVPPARRRTITRNGKDDEIDEFDLCEPIIKKSIEFHPLVRERTALKCALKIVFLRREEPGRIYQGGDIDNRLKTLLDALSVPQHDEQVVGTMSPIYCLLEDDSLVTALDIQTQKLLSQPGTTKHYVHLLIEVDVRVTNPHAYNQMFLGD